MYNYFGDTMYKRENTRVVKIGNRYIGGNNPILIQSMTNTKTKDINKTVEQILELEKYGCDIIRVAILDMKDALSIPEIKKRLTKIQGTRFRSHLFVPVTRRHTYHREKNNEQLPVHP